MSAWIEIAKQATQYLFFRVALYMSAWIEIEMAPVNEYPINRVALYMSAWIEISKCGCSSALPMVALYMSAWIEISQRGPVPGVV